MGTQTGSGKCEWKAEMGTETGNKTFWFINVCLRRKNKNKYSRHISETTLQRVALQNMRDTLVFLNINASYAHLRHNNL